jgi:selenocysteine lyase/cysteine desulfurase
MQRDTQPHSQPDVQQLRAEFPGLADGVYLNSAAESLGSTRLAAALQRYAADKQRGARGREAMYATEAACRGRAAALLGRAPEEIAFCASTTEALNTVLLGLEWRTGDNLVTTDLEFPSALIAALHIGERFGVEVRVVKHEGGAVTPAALAARMDDRTRLVLISHVSFRSGYRIDLAAVAEVAHAHGALLLVDAAQSLGAVGMEAVTAGQVDFLAACTFKWMLGSHGLAVLYCHRERLETLRPPALGWRSVQDYFSVVGSLRFALQEDARRFETGMLDYGAVYALHEGLGLLAEIGADAVERRILELSGRLVAGLQAQGIAPLTPDDPERRAGIVAFESPRYAEIGQALQQRGIHVWTREGRVRASAHVYNTADEVDAYCAALAAIG